MAKGLDGRDVATGRVIIPLVALAVVAVLAVAMAWLYGWVSDWTRVHNGDFPRLGDLANAGQFFSLVIGIPLAFITLLLGVVGVWHFNSTRDEVEILRFYEEKILTPFGKRLQQITTQVQELVRAANRCRDTSAEIWKRYVESCGIKPPTAAGFAAWLNDKDRGQLKTALENIRYPIRTWRDHYLDVLSRTYETALAFDRIDQLLAVKWGTAIAYLRAHLPEAMHASIGVDHSPMALQCDPVSKACAADLEGARNHADDPHHLCHCMVMLADSSDEMDAEFADVFKPSGNQTTIEYLGALLGQRRFDLAEPRAGRRMGDVKITGYVVNYGAAVVLTLFQYLPTRASLCRSFAKTYGTRSGISQRFLKGSGPEPAQFISARTYQSLAAQLGHWERLLLVRTTAGDLECYDPARHGAIPATGYSNFPARS